MPFKRLDGKKERGGGKKGEGDPEKDKITTL